MHVGVTLTVRESACECVLIVSMIRTRNRIARARVRSTGRATGYLPCGGERVDTYVELEELCSL